MLVRTETFVKFADDFSYNRNSYFCKALISSVMIVFKMHFKLFNHKQLIKPLLFRFEQALKNTCQN